MKNRYTFLLLAPALVAGFLLAGAAYARTNLVANKTLYIDNVSGSDTNNDCTSALAPCATFARAANQAQMAYDLQGFNITIQGASGQTWNDTIFNNAWVGGGLVEFDVNGGSLNSSTAGSAAFTLSTPLGPGLGNTFFYITNATVTCSNGANGLQISGGLLVTGTVTFGSCAGGAQVFADSFAGRWLPLSNYTVSGSADYHYFALGGGLIDVNSTSMTVTISGTPSFGKCFAGADDLGLVIGYATYSGAATGTRYCATLNGVIDTNGGGATHLPGSVAGTTATGGQYN